MKTTTSQKVRLVVAVGLLGMTVNSSAKSCETNMSPEKHAQIACETYIDEKHFGINPGDTGNTTTYSYVLWGPNDEEDDDPLTTGMKGTVVFKDKGPAEKYTFTCKIIPRGKHAFKVIDAKIRRVDAT